MILHLHLEKVLIKFQFNRYVPGLFLAIVYFIIVVVHNGLD